MAEATGKAPNSLRINTTTAPCFRGTGPIELESAAGAPAASGESRKLWGIVSSASESKQDTNCSSVLFCLLFLSSKTTHVLSGSCLRLLVPFRRKPSSFPNVVLGPGACRLPKSASQTAPWKCPRHFPPFCNHMPNKAHMEMGNGHYDNGDFAFHGAFHPKPG